MRGVYTAGVLDFFLDMGLEFEYIIGVSAGACNAVSYMSKQRGRNYNIHMSYCDDPRYISLRNYLFQGSICGEQFMFHRIPDELIPFDYEAYCRSKSSLLAVTTDCITGQPTYLPLTDCSTQINYLLASSSLPMVSRMVEIDGKKLLDGGVSDSIPLGKSMADGNVHNVVVLTRPAGYRKENDRTSLHYRLHYPQYPQLVRAILNRPMVYNHSLTVTQREEEQGRAAVIRPSRPLKIARFEKDRNRLSNLYMMGYTDAHDAYDATLAVCKGATNVTLRGGRVE